MQAASITPPSSNVKVFRWRLNSGVNRWWGPYGKSRWWTFPMGKQGFGKWFSCPKALCRFPVALRRIYPARWLQTLLAALVTLFGLARFAARRRPAFCRLSGSFGARLARFARDVFFGWRGLVHSRG